MCRRRMWIGSTKIRLYQYQLLIQLVKQLFNWVGNYSSILFYHVNCYTQFLTNKIFLRLINVANPKTEKIKFIVTYMWQTKIGPGTILQRWSGRLVRNATSWGSISFNICLTFSRQNYSFLPNSSCTWVLFRF